MPTNFAQPTHRDAIRPVYLSAAGSYLPGPPIGNDAMETYLGPVHGNKSRARALTLRQNGIKTRHYALDIGGEPTHTSAELATHAVRSMFEGRSDVRLADTDFLAVAGSFGDRMLPGLASPVQHALGLDGIEIASFQSVCGSSAMALQSAFLQLKCGEKQQAVVVGSEFVSRILRGSYLEPTRYATRERGVEDLSVEFLRWTLSDGAGAVMLSSTAAPDATTLRLDWVDVVSYANRFDVCMQLGQADGSWASYPTPMQAAEAGAFCLRQDFRTLREMFPVWVARLKQLSHSRDFDPAGIDWYLCHFSSYALGREVMQIMRDTDCMIPEERWYSNLRSRGNTGAASIFVMLEEFMRTTELRPGQRILLCIPESGWGIVSHALLTVV